MATEVVEVVEGETLVVTVLIEGPQGPSPDPRIIVSATAPEDPEENLLWIQIPE